MPQLKVLELDARTLTEGTGNFNVRLNVHYDPRGADGVWEFCECADSGKSIEHGDLAAEDLAYLAEQVKQAQDEWKRENSDDETEMQRLVREEGRYGQSNQ